MGESANAKAFATWLQGVRARRGLSQEAVALEAGIGMSTYARIERYSGFGAANPTLNTLLRLMGVLEVSDDELIELKALIIDANTATSIRSVHVQ